MAKPNRRRAATTALLVLPVVAALGCTKANDTVSSTPGNGPAATAAQGTSAPATSAPGTTARPLVKIPDDEVDTFTAKVSTPGQADQNLKGALLCRSLEDGRVRMVFGENVDFRLTFPEDLDGDGTIELFDKDTKTGSGTASINAEKATARGGPGLRFGFSASFRFDSGDKSGSGTMEGSGSCQFKAGSGGSTTTSTRAPRSSTTKAVPTPSIRLEVPPQNATAFAKDLVTIGREAYVDDKSWSPADAWVAAGLPKDAASGYAVVADGSKTIVSGFEPLVDKGSDSLYLAFAVADVNGDCAFGLITAKDGTVNGKSQGTESTCTGAEAAKAFGVG